MQSFYAIERWQKLIQNHTDPLDVSAGAAWAEKIGVNLNKLCSSPEPNVANLHRKQCLHTQSRRELHPSVLYRVCSMLEMPMIQNWVQVLINFLRCMLIALHR